MDIAIAFHVAVRISTYFLQSHDHVHVFFTIYAIALFCTSQFSWSQYFAGPGFEPWTMQDLIFMGPGFNSRARMPVSGQVNSWPMSLASRSEDQGALQKKKTFVRKKICKAMACGKRKPQWGKNPNKPVPACKNLVCAGKNSSWCVTCLTYMMVCILYKRKCLWRGRLMSLLYWYVTCTILVLNCSPKSRWWLPSAWNPDCTIIWKLW